MKKLFMLCLLLFAVVALPALAAIDHPTVVHVSMAGPPHDVLPAPAITATSASPLVAIVATPSDGDHASASPRFHPLEVAAEHRDKAGERLFRNLDRHARDRADPHLALRPGSYPYAFALNLRGHRPYDVGKGLNS